MDIPTIIESAVDVKNAFPNPQPPRNIANIVMFGERPERVANRTPMRSPIISVFFQPNLVVN